MPAKLQIESMLRHLEWANRRVLESLDAQPEVAIRTDALRLFAHILGAERIWHSRIRGDGEEAIPWPSYALDDLAPQLERNVADLSELVSSASDGDLKREIEYETTSGDVHVNRLSDILVHVMLHGAYHRGQIAWALRHGGGTPEGTDFITMVRRF